jgi:hypothetical protein
MMTRKNINQDGLILTCLMTLSESQILYDTELNVKEVGNMERSYVGIPEYSAPHSKE